MPQIFITEHDGSKTLKYMKYIGKQADKIYGTDIKLLTHKTVCLKVKFGEEGGGSQHSDFTSQDTHYRLQWKYYHIFKFL